MNFEHIFQLHLKQNLHFPSSTEVKNERVCISTPLICLCVVYRDSFNFQDLLLGYYKPNLNSTVIYRADFELQI